MSSGDLKKVSELRVADLRGLLEKRGLDKNGVKQVLVQRMRAALTTERHDPDKPIFRITPGAKANEELIEILDSDSSTDVNNVNPNTCAETKPEQVGDSVDTEMDTDASMTQSVEESTEESSEYVENPASISYENTPSESQISAIQISESSNSEDQNSKDQSSENQICEDQNLKDQSCENQISDNQNFANISSEINASEETISISSSSVGTDLRDGNDLINNQNFEEEKNNADVVDLTEETQNATHIENCQPAQTQNVKEDNQVVKSSTEKVPKVRILEDIKISAGSSIALVKSVIASAKKLDPLNSSNYSSNILEEGEEEHESPIRLTLDDDESLQDDNETVEKLADEEFTNDKKKNEDQDKQKKETVAQSEKVRPPDNQIRKPIKKLRNPIADTKGDHIVWVSNVAKNSLATDLQSALSHYGKVKEVKILVNGKYPGASCFGHVTMASTEDANNVINKLHNTELNGHIIKIERFDKVRADQLKLMKDSKRGISPANKHKPENEKQDELGDNKKEREKKIETKEKSHTDDKAAKDKHKPIESKRSKESVTREDAKKLGRKEKRRSRSLEKRERDVLTFARIKEERERERRRERDRAIREENRRRRAESLRQREIERRQRQESLRLEKEREKLRIEKEKVEREKAELLRMEREHHRLEREKIARQKVEIARSMMRLEEEDRRSIKRPTTYRNSSERYDDRKRLPVNDSIDRHRLDRDKPSPRDKIDLDRPFLRPLARNDDDDRRTIKRSAPFRGDDRFDDRKRSISDRHFDAPPPPRFDSGPSKTREHSPKKFSSIGSKDHYNKPRSSYDSSDNSYSDKRSRDFSEPSRYDQRNSLLWPSQTSKFSGNSVSKSWEKNDWRSTSSSNDRWTSSQGPSGTGRQYTGNSTISTIPPMCPPPPGINNYGDMRYDYSKPVGNSVRKY